MTEVNVLMNEFASLKTPEQEAEFKKKFRALLASKTDEERAQFDKDMIEGAHLMLREADKIIGCSL